MNVSACSSLPPNAAQPFLWFFPGSCNISFCHTIPTTRNTHSPAWPQAAKVLLLTQKNIILHVSCGCVYVRVCVCECVSLGVWVYKPQKQVLIHNKRAAHFSIVKCKSYKMEFSVSTSGLRGLAVPRTWARDLKVLHSVDKLLNLIYAVSLIRGLCHRIGTCCKPTCTEVQRK